jgi:hypothetical protein
MGERTERKGTMKDECKGLEVENALLRGTLFLTASSLKGYHESPCEKIEGTPMVRVTVNEVVRGKAQEALERADRMLKG